MREPMQTRRILFANRWLLWGLAVLVGLAAVGAIGLDVYRRAGGMRATTTTVASILSAQPDKPVKAVVRLQQPSGRNTYSAELLESSDGTVYRETPAQIHIALAGDTAVVMGAAADIKPGAIVQVAGTIDSTRTLHATQIVILSGYVRIQNDR